MSVRVRYGEDNRLPMLPVAPLFDRARKLVDALEEAKLTREEACSTAGVAPRLFRQWETGIYATVRFDVADRVLIALGLNWFDVWDPAEYPEVAARLEA